MKIGVPAATTIVSALLLMSPLLGQAASPHFIGTPTVNKSISGTTATLTTSGKVAGLGSEPTQFFLTTSGVTAETECDNHGKGANPPGQDASFGPTQGQTTTIQPRNGQITFNNARSTFNNCDCRPSRLPRQYETSINKCNILRCCTASSAERTRSADL